MSRRAEAGSEASPGPDDVATARETVEDLRARGTPLPEALRKKLEAELGIDLHAVRIHTDARAAAAAKQIGARAFAVDTNIFFAAGAYDPEATQGIELIAHEVAHVAQHLRGEQPIDENPIAGPEHGTERQAEAFARSFTDRKARDDHDPASVVNRMRAEGNRVDLPSRELLEEQLGRPLDFVEVYAGDAARVACGVLSAGAFAVRNIVALADPSPQRELLLHELAHVVQMGGVRAPSEFSPSTLKVSDHNDAAEHDARHVASGGAVGVHANADIIHRNQAGQNPAGGAAPAAAEEPKWDIDAAVDAFKTKFEPTLIKRKPGEDYFFFVDDSTEPDGRHRFESSSTETFQRAAYQHAIGHTSEADKKKSENDLVKLRDQNKWKDLGLVHVAPGDPTKDSRRWAWVDRAEPKIQKDVRYVFEEERSKSNPTNQWKTYCEAVAVCHEKGSLKQFKQIEIGGRAYAFDGKRRFAPNEADNKIFRDELEKAVLADEQFAWRVKSYWKVYYDHIAKPAKLPQGLAGEMFKNLVKRDLGATETFGEGEAFFYHEELKTKTRKRKADGFTISGSQILLESKSGQAGGPGDDDNSELALQAKDYAFILREGVPAYHPTDAAAHGPFTTILYTFQTPEIAAKWEPQLKKWFGAQFDKVLIIPPPGTIGVVQAKTNPTFNIPLTDKNTTNHRFTTSPFVHSGMNVREAVIKTKAPGSPELATGSTITYDVSLGNKVVSSAKPVTKTLTPEGASAGRFDSKIDGLESSLKKIFKRLTTDARLVDGGVEATITVTPGASGIPGLEIVEPTGITVRYVDGDLKVTGAVGVQDAKGRFTTKVSVGYASGEWTFEGSVDIPKDVVPGLSAFTGRVKYEAGKWTIGADAAAYEKQFGTIRLHGEALGISYNVDKGAFDGFLRLEADLGMFGKAGATADLKNNKITNASFSYDSPELTYPAKSEKPAFKGTVGGTLKYDDGKFSGTIRGTANLNIPALKSVAGEEGAGLAVDARINADGSYSGTVRTTSPLKFGKHIEVPSISCTLDKEGALSGSFEIKIVKIKYLTDARIKCKVTKDGVEIEELNVEVPFGNEEKGKFWGKLKAGYAKDKGLQIGGDVNYKIKEGMIATGTLKYSTETHAIDLEMKVSEITLIDKKISKTLFKASKQIPVVNIYGLGVYIDIGFDLGFDFGFNLGLKPTVAFEGLSLETWEFKQIEAKLELLGLIYAQLTGTPKLGLGVFALDPSILRGGGGLKVPIVGRAEIKPTGTLGLSYTPAGGVDGEAKIGMSASFGIMGYVKPYAEFAVFDDLWNPTWEGGELTSFEILKPKELFNFEVDLAGDMTKREAPALPEENAARDAPKSASAPTGTRTFPEEKAAPTEHGAEAPKNPKTETEPKEGGDEGPFSLNALFDKLKAIPGFATAEKVFKIAKKVWDVVKPVWELVEPLFDLIGKRIEEFMDLFDTELPKSADDVLPWVWKLAKKVLNLAFGGLPDLAKAIWKMIDKAVDFAMDLINRAVKEGWIGVKRHSYYVWKPYPFDNYEFMAASEYKINIPGVANIGRGGPDDILLSPSSAVAIVLYEALEAVGIGYTYRGNSDINEPYNDFWSGDGARG